MYPNKEIFVAKIQFYFARLEAIIPYTAKRRVHAFCVGPPRSGTHSLAYLLQNALRSEHEPAFKYTIYHMLQWLNNCYDEKDIKSLLLARDKYLQLEFESSHFLIFILDVLVKIFPSAKYVITLRDPCSWLNSEINQNLFPNHFAWRALEEFRYGKYDFQFPVEEQNLKEKGVLYPVSAYLSFWRDHYDKILRLIPPQSVFYLNIRQINSCLEDLSKFLNIDYNQLNTSFIHSGKNEHKHINIFEHVDGNYLRSLIQFYCGEHLNRKFSKYF
jgi:hypothetical protein